MPGGPWGDRWPSRELARQRVEGINPVAMTVALVDVPTAVLGGPDALAVGPVDGGQEGAPFVVVGADLDLGARVVEPAGDAGVAEDAVDGAHPVGVAVAARSGGTGRPAATQARTMTSSACSSSPRRSLTQRSRSAIAKPVRSSGLGRPGR
jgi:hypothetical protein